MSSEGSLTTILVQEIVDQADRLGLIWKIRPGTVVGGTNPANTQVTLDGDDVALNAISTIGVQAPGTRVFCLLVPPSGIYIIGCCEPPDVTVPTAGAGLVETAGTFHVVNTDGHIVVTADSIDIGAGLLAQIDGAAQKFLDTTVGDGVSTTIDIVHGISGGVTHIYGATLMRNATGVIVTPGVRVFSSTTVRLTFLLAPALNEFSFGFTY